MIVAAGLFNLALAVFHAMFWRLFRWPESLAGLDRVNRAILQLVNIFLAAFFVMVGLAFVIFAGEIAGSQLGRFLLASMAVGWVFRLVLQPVYFGWKSGKSLFVLAVLLLGVVLHLGALVGTVS